MDRPDPSVPPRDERGPTPLRDLPRDELTRRRTQFERLLDSGRLDDRGAAVARVGLQKIQAVLDWRAFEQETEALVARPAAQDMAPPKAKAHRSTPRVCTDRQKARALRVIRKHLEVSISEVARKLDIGRSSLDHWSGRRSRPASCRRAAAEGRGGRGEAPLHPRAAR